MAKEYRNKAAARIGATALMVLLVGVPAVHAQWQEVARNLLSPETQRVGALRFAGGEAWAGTNGLYYSKDTGSTWQPVTSFPSYSGISDIAIYDSLHVLVSTHSDGLFLTTDGGRNWTNYQPGGGGRFQQSEFTQVAFNGSTSVLHALQYNSGMLYTSINGGVSWQAAAPTSSFYSNGSLCFAIARDKTIYVLSYIGGQGWINHSTDEGQSWSGDSNPTDGDCNTLAADSCSNERLYLTNENTVARTGDAARIDLTADAGASWQTISSMPLDYYNGSLASTARVLYVGTVPNSGDGIDRSTDSGMTWQNIGGPTEQYDTRSLAVVSDNIVLALDANGNIWRTLNSGGKPISLPNQFSATPSALFQTDTISCDSLTRTVNFASGGCSPLSVAGVRITGPDSASFRAGNLSLDSVSVTLYGRTEGAQQAQLLLTLDNGTNDTVALSGYVNTTPSVLSITSANVQTDTLGATVAVPITVNGLVKPETIDLVLHYSGSLDYLGSFSLSGTKLDVSGGQYPGRSMLHIINAIPGRIAGYAEFRVFDDSDQASYATFDSLTVLTAISPCEYSLPAAITSTITTVSGCGIPILSQLIHFGQTPLLSIVPNPTANNVRISSSLDLGNTTIAIYDMLGTLRNETEVTVRKFEPMELALPDADGVYTVAIESAAGAYLLRVIKQR